MGKSVEPDVYERLLVRKRWHVGTPAFTPVAHRRDVHAVEVRITVIAFSCFGHELAPILQVQRVGEIRLPDSSVLVAGLVGPPRTGFLVPLGQLVLIRIGHPTPSRWLTVR